jgi:hypothetical protein
VTVDPLGLVSGAAPRRAGETARLVEGPSFDALLRQARTGEISSHVPVRVARNAGITLSDEQLTRLAAAADRAESEGAARALVLIDGKALTMDVPTRTITGKVDASATRVLAGIDAVVTVGPEGVRRVERDAMLSRLLPARRPWDDGEEAA